MKIDWSELQKGFDEEQVKEAGIGSALKGIGSKLIEGIKGILGRGGKPSVHPAPTPHVSTPHATPQGSNVGKAIGAGVAAATIPAAYNTYNSAKNWLGNSAEGVAEASPGLLSLLNQAAGGQSASQGGTSPGYMLPSQHGGVSTWRNPLSVHNPSQPVFKRAGIMDDVADVARKRVVNSVINEVTKTNPFGVDSPRPQMAPQNSEKEIQLVSEYPEIKEMLKNEENKAYLERLLKEKA